MSLDISSANLIATLTIGTLYPIPQTLSAFYVDSAFMADAVDEAETVMGVDGVMAAGYTPVITPMTVDFLPSSPSIVIFDAWRAATKAARRIFPAAMTIQYPSIGKSYILTNGVLVRPKVIPDSKKILGNQQFVIHWGSVDVSLI
jgi:hypothetical protein